MTLRAHAEHLGPLPIPVRPATGESIDSYIHRLARANHLRPSYLHGYLCGPPTYLGAIRPERLAAVAGRQLSALTQALPALAVGSAPARPRRPEPSFRSAQPPNPMKIKKQRLFALIRQDAAGGYSIRALAARHRVHRRTIRQALASATPPPRKTPNRTSWALNHARDHINTLASQHLTNRQIWERLFDEYGVVISHTTISAYIRQRRNRST